LVVYTKPDVEMIAIEPVSHVNNALNLLARGVATADALGLVILQPGETFSCEMRIDVERAA
jgi:aldose 1-epimerase